MLVSPAAFRRPQARWLLNIASATATQEAPAQQQPEQAAKPAKRVAYRVLRPESLKQRMVDAWEVEADTYDQESDFTQELAERLLQVAGLEPNQSVLDVACGTGHVCVPAAQAVGRFGHVMAIDLSPSMVAKAMLKVNDAGLANVSWMIADVEAAAFPDGFFDRILCSSGIMYLQYPERSLAQMLTWLKPGGELHFNINQEDCVRATTTFHRLVHERFGLALADWSAPLGNPRRAKAVLERCGYDEVQITTTEETLLYADCTAEDYAEATWQGLAGGTLLAPLDHKIPPEQMDEIGEPYLEAVTALAEPWVSDDGVRNPYQLLWCKARRPS